MSDDLPVEDLWIPAGVRTSTVQKVTDTCALLLPELMEGRTVQLLLEPTVDRVQVSFLGSSQMPRLAADKRESDRFRTADRQVPITAKNGRCGARRTQHYEGKADTQTDYRVTFHSEDAQPTGDCTETPVPCATEASFVIKWCPPLIPCP